MQDIKNKPINNKRRVFTEHANMNNKDEYEEILRLIEEQADDWFADNTEEFEDLDNAERPFRFEYQHEAATMKGITRFKKWSGE